MLRISELDGAGEATLLRIEGDLIGLWVDEVRKACAPFLRNGHHLTLDLAEVALTDRRAIALLKELVASQVALVNCSAFLSEQLREEKHQQPSE